MINARSLATLGIGFSALAIATLGVIAETQPQDVVTAIEITATAWPVISLVAACAGISIDAAYSTITTIAAMASITTLAAWPTITTTTEYPTIEVTRDP